MEMATLYVVQTFMLKVPNGCSAGMSSCSEESREAETLPKLCVKLYMLNAREIS